MPGGLNKICDNTRTLTVPLTIASQPTVATPTETCFIAGLLQGHAEVTTTLKQSTVHSLCYFLQFGCLFYMMWQ